MSALQVRWLRRSERSLEQAADHIAESDPQAAHRLISRIRKAAEYLAAHPHLGRAGRVAGTREFIVPGTSYILPYRVRTDHIEILHVLHGKRRWPAEL